ncbi:MAG: class I SAM-dependent methyltransferase [Pseudonocardiaceae bacterium]
MHDDLNRTIRVIQDLIEAAEFYESAFVPAFFAQWAPILCEAAGVGPGQRVLDVGCGAGIVARTAADLVAPEGQVVGLDRNEAMLTVARRVRPDIEFHQGDAAALPFPDGSFDIALCQMALMFLPDRRTALREMRRVIRPGATVAIAVPSRLDVQVAFSPFVDLAARHAGPAAVSLLSTYFVCGGLRVTSARAHVGVYRAPSVDAFVTAEVESIPSSNASATRSNSASAPMPATCWHRSPQPRQHQSTLPLPCPGSKKR